MSLFRYNNKNVINATFACYNFFHSQMNIVANTYFHNILNFTKTKNLSQIISSNSFAKFHTSLVNKAQDLMPTPKELVSREQIFQNIAIKDKSTFLHIIKAFADQNKLRRGHVEFIYAAVNYMEKFGVQYDLEVYKKIMDILPKGKMIPKNLIQAEFYHFARHQHCALWLLDKMEYLGVFPDKEMGEMIVAIFGKSSHVYKKFGRMLYWMPKLKNINPYLLPDPLPSDVRELARLALKKMSVDPRSKITEYEAENLEDSLDKTWIMSAQSPVQQRLINNHDQEKALYVDGPFLIWLRRLSMTYFILRADPINYPKYEVDEDDVSNLPLYMFGDPKPLYMTLRPSSVHEQEDATIMAMCCTGTSSRDSLLSWIRFLRLTNPKLDKIPVLFTLRSSPSSLVAVNASKETSSDVEDAQPV